MAPANSTPVGPAPMTTNRSQGARPSALGSASACSNAEKMRRRMSISVLHRLQAPRHLLPVVVAEVVVAHAGGDDKTIVRDPSIVAEHDLCCRRIHRRHVPYQHFRQSVPLEDRTQWGAHITRGESARSDLVQQRLEEMGIAPIDHGHRDPGTPELTCRVQTAETTADDDDTMGRVLSHFSSTPCLGGDCINGATGCGIGAGGGGSVSV